MFYCASPTHPPPPPPTPPGKSWQSGPYNPSQRRKGHLRKVFQAFLRQKEPQCGGGASNLLRTKLIICLGEVPAPRSRPTPDLRLPRPSGSGTGGYIKKKGTSDADRCHRQLQQVNTQQPSMSQPKCADTSQTNFPKSFSEYRAPPFPCPSRPLPSGGEAACGVWGDCRLFEPQPCLRPHPLRPCPPVS